jgi:hypothetical protein
MKITQIDGKNIKGSTFSQPLAAITLFHGLSEAGKSTRIEALTLALCRCLPGTASRPSDIYDLLASGTTMSVRAVADDGSEATAEWSRGRKGMEAEFAGTLEAPRLLFSTSEFLDLTPKERTKFLFSVLPPPDLAKVGPEAIIANLKNVKCEPHTEAHEVAIKEFSDAVTESWTESQMNHQTVQEWLQELVEDIATRTKEAKASAKTMRQTALGNTALRHDAPALGPVEAAKRKAQDALTAAVQAESAALNDFSNAEAKVQETKQVADTLVDETATIEEIANLTAARITAGLVQPAGLEPTEATMPNKRPTDTATRETFNTANFETKGRNLTRVASERETDRIIQAIQDAQTKTCCPTCGSDISEFQKKVVAKLKKELNTAEERLTQAIHDHGVAEVAEKQATEALSHILRAQTAWDADNAAVQECNRAARAAWNSRQTTYNLAQGQINAATAKITTLQDAIKANTAAREAAALLPSLATASQEAAGRYTVAKTAREAAKVALGAAETAHRTALADAAAARTAQQAIERAEAIEAKAAVGQELRDFLDELLKMSIQQSIGPLVDLANSLCQGILSAPLTFQDGEIQMVKPTGAHSHRSMSGSSKALAYAALSVGLAASSPVKLVILDELSRLDADRQTKLVNRLGELIKDGKIHQAILASPTPVFGCKMPEGVNFTQVKIG